MKENLSLLKDLLELSRTKFYKYMMSVWKNVYIDKLDKIVNEYNNTNHRTIEIKPVNVKWSIYIDFNLENHNKDPTFEVGDHVRILKYNNEVISTVPWTYIISGLNTEEIVGTF